MLKLTTNLTSKLCIVTNAVYMLFFLTACTDSKLERYEKLVATVDSVEIYFNENDLKSTLKPEQVEVFKDILTNNIETKTQSKFHSDVNIKLFSQQGKVGSILITENATNPSANFVSDDLGFGFGLTYGIDRYLLETYANIIAMKEIQVVKAWQEAADDLNIEIQSPFTLLTTNNDLTFQLLIKNFGSKLGTLTLSTDDMTDFNTPKKYGFYCSALNPLAYDKYDREHFIETLTDWGYYGNAADKPDWYEGPIYE